MSTINTHLTTFFEELFDKHLQSQIPHWKAYELAEQEFEQRYGHRKYASFDSYRLVRRRKITKKRNIVTVNDK
jgi:hypothetical protein